ncbi:FkbM family methyltransferase [Arthrobacter sp. H5]|uniref:FkbM family methyltransferase n=1 Tax=Arthrobacter sp. H5 TaxID=1267973 RepID=UPI0006871B82|nr:FkbM family methyltransferase [Arthrobacter sp. H5]
MTQLRLAEAEVLGLRAVVRTGDHVFDVGAAYGMYTFPLARIVGAGGRVYSFEPQPRQQRMAAMLSRMLRMKNIRATQSVLGAEQGEHTMLLPSLFGFPIHGHAHVMDGVENALSPQRVHSRRWTTRMSTVDAWCERHNAEDVSFIKADVEGFEPNVIAGAIKTIEQFKPSLLLEIEDRNIGRYGRDANQFANEIRTRWPDYGMYIWADGDWKPAATVRVGVRNYLFATDAAFLRAATPPA